MYNIEETFEALRRVLDDNFASKTKDFWQIYFQWWRFFYSLNENLEQTLILADKIVLIEQFMQYNQELSKMEVSILERNKLKSKNLPPVEEIPFAPHIQNMQALFKKEQERFRKLMQEVKKQKTLGSSSPRVKRRGRKQKWLRT